MLVQWFDLDARHTESSTVTKRHITLHIKPFNLEWAMPSRRATVLLQGANHLELACVLTL